LVEKKTGPVLAILKDLLAPDVLADPKQFRLPVWTLAFSFFFKTQMFFIMLLVAVAGPGLISGDLRFNALPLYFARPLTRFDYFLGKLGVIGILVAAVAVLPAVFAYVIGLCFSMDIGVIKDTWKILLASVAYGLVVTVSTGSLVLAMSSLTRRSLYVGIAWAGLWIISGSVGGAMMGIHREQLGENIYREEMTRWLTENPPPPGVPRPSPFDGYWGPPRSQVGFFGGGPRLGAKNKNDHWREEWLAATIDARSKVRVRRSEELRRDWRPLFSYVANLERISDQLLNTDGAWVTIGKAVVRAQKVVPGPGRANLEAPDERELAEQIVPQYPWQWSAGVLAGLLGLSSWILTTRVKSLDRLK
jgi:hypothetical protein